MTRATNSRHPGNRFGTRWRGKLPIPQHVNPLVREFYQILNDEQTTITEVAERGGPIRSTISDWRYLREPLVSNLQAALNVVGYELVIRKIKE